MNIEQEIITEFRLTPETLVPDDFIENNDDVMWLEGEIDYLIYVPSYMLWCVRNKESYGSLVCDKTINAIAEFGRCKDQGLSHLNFKYLCSDSQKSVVAAFLSWVSENMDLCHDDQINRSLKHW